MGVEDWRLPEGPRRSVPGRILVVDDEPMIREVFEAILSTHGHTVTLAPDVEGALAVMAVREFDLILSDVSMPGRSGLDLLRIVREACRDIPFILVTGAPTTEGHAAASRFDATNYLSKPISAAALRAEVDSGLGLYRTGVPFGRNGARV